MKKKTKASRAAHFRKHGKMDDDNPAAYKPAPGDKGAKTKPSTYTKQFKQMYDENAEEGTKELVDRYKKETPGQNESVDEKFFGKTGAFGDKSVGGTLMPAFDQWMDKKVYNKKKYEKALRSYLNWRRKNPKAGSTGAFDFLRRMGVERPRLVIDFMQDLIKKGKLPKHLSFDKPRTGKSKTIFPNQDFRGVRAQKEDAVKQARTIIDREKEQDKKKHDRMLDRARLVKAKNKNRETK